MMETGSGQGCSKCLVHDEHAIWGGSCHSHPSINHLPIFTHTHVHTQTHTRTHVWAHACIYSTYTNMPTQTYTHTTHTANINTREEKKKPTTGSLSHPCTHLLLMLLDKERQRRGRRGSRRKGPERGQEFTQKLIVKGTGERQSSSPLLRSLLVT